MSANDDEATPEFLDERRLCALLAIAGDYTIELIEHPRLPRREARVTVVAGQRTRVRMPPP